MSLTWPKKSSTIIDLIERKKIIGSHLLLILFPRLNIQIIYNLLFCSLKISNIFFFSQKLLVTGSSKENFCLNYKEIISLLIPFTKYRLINWIQKCFLDFYDIVNKKNIITFISYSNVKQNCLPKKHHHFLVMSKSDLELLFSILYRLVF